MAGGDEGPSVELMSIDAVQFTGDGDGGNDSDVAEGGGGSEEGSEGGLDGYVRHPRINPTPCSPAYQPCVASPLSRFGAAQDRNSRLSPQTSSFIHLTLELMDLHVHVIPDGSHGILCIINTCMYCTF